MLDFASENVSRGGVPNVGAQITQGRRWMNKSDLIAAMANRAGVSNKDAGACLDALFDAFTILGWELWRFRAILDRVLT